MKFSLNFLLVLVLLYAQNTNAQSLAINTDGSTANTSALLDVKSSAKGVLIPRMSRTERNAIVSPVMGLMIFQNGPDSIGFHYYDGTKWSFLVSSSNADSVAWRTNGNTGTTDAANFIGTIDDVPLNFRVNNQKSGRIASAGETYLGYLAGSVSTSNYSTGIGYRALASNTTGNDNTAVGREALRSNTIGTANTAAGKDALLSNSSGSSNVAMGYQALVNNGTGSNNTALGNYALRGNNASNGTAIGYNALRNNTTGSDNIAIGTQALFTNISGIKNIAIGGEVLYASTGDQNIGIGYYTLHNNTTGSQNVSVGEGSAITNTTGNHNTTIGFQPLYANSTGNDNVALGYQAGYAVTGSGNVMIGNRAGSFETGSNKLYIANNDVNPPIIYGDFSNKTLGFGTITPNSTYGYAKVEIASEGYLAPADLLIRNAVSNAGYAPGLVFQHARGVLATPLTVSNGDYLAAISTMNYDGSSYVLSAAVDMFADGTVAGGIVPTRIHFNTMNAAGAYASRVTIKNDGKVGIGTISPSARTHVSGGNFLVSGTYGTDSTLGFAGAGTKMFFYPRKAAFRAGAVGGTQWDDANIGNYSVGLGVNAQAKSDYSVSIGEGNIAETAAFAVAIGRQNHSTGFASLAMGHFSEATGDYSSSIGLRDTVTAFGASSLGGYNKVSGTYGFTAGFANTVSAGNAIALGQGNTASASNGIALGQGNIVSASNGIALGQGNTVSANASAAIGYQNTATGYVTFVAGRSNYTTGNHSTAFGYTDSSSADQAFTSGMFNTVKGNNSAAIGSYNFAPSYGEVTIGNFATQYTALNAIGINAADRVFTIGNGTNIGSRSNAMVVLKSGNVGLGTSLPNSTLHVDGTVAIGTSVNIAGGASGSPVSLLNQKSYVGLLPANATNNYYQLPDPTLYPGRTYIIRNNSSADPANITAAAGLLFPGSSNTGAATFTLNPTSSSKTIMAISDGSNWIMMLQN